MIGVLKKIESIWQIVITLVMIVDYIFLPFITIPPVYTSLNGIFFLLLLYCFFSFFWFYILYQKQMIFNGKETFAFKLIMFFRDEKQKSKIIFWHKMMVYYGFFFLSFIFLLLFSAVIYNLIWLKIFH